MKQTRLSAAPGWPSRLTWMEVPPHALRRFAPVRTASQLMRRVRRTSKRAGEVRAWGVATRWVVAALSLAAAGCGRGERQTYATPTAEEVRAIAVAERFVVANGYTAVIPDPKGITPEMQERSLPASVVWELHHDRLEPAAYGIAPGAGASDAGWTVFFEPKGGGDYLRGVEVAPELAEMAMSHYELRVDAPMKVLRSRTDTPGRRRTGR